MSETLFSIGDGPSISKEEDVSAMSTTQAEEKPAIDPQVTPVETPVVTPAFSFLGENKRHYLFVTHEHAYDYMSSPAMEAFSKTISALKLQLADIAVINLAKYQQPIAIIELFNAFAPEAIILLGLPAKSLGLADTDPNSIMKHEGIKVFQTYSFETMLTDADKKRDFWTTLKTILV